MTIVKKIKLELIEDYLKNIVGLCSIIRVSQEELKYVNSKLRKNENEFASGGISENLYKGNKTNLENEKRKLNEKINLNIEKTLKTLENIKNVLNEIEI